MCLWLGKHCSVDADAGSVVCSSTITANRLDSTRRQPEPNNLALLCWWPTSSLHFLTSNCHRDMFRLDRHVQFFHVGHVQAMVNLALPG